MQDVAVISEHHHYNEHFSNVKTFQLQKQIVLIINFHYMQGCRLSYGTMCLIIIIPVGLFLLTAQPLYVVCFCFFGTRVKLTELLCTF